MLFHDYLALSRQYYTFCSNSKAVPPVPPPSELDGGGDKSRGIYRKSRGISPGARGGDQSRGIKKPEMVTLNPEARHQNPRNGNPVGGPKLGAKLNAFRTRKLNF